MPAAFISYCRANEKDVASLQQDVRDLDYDVWMDNELTGGQAWWDHILENIHNCDCVLFALSGAALESQACRLEFGYQVLMAALRAVSPQSRSIELRECTEPEDSDNGWATLLGLR